MRRPGHGRAGSAGPGSSHEMCLKIRLSEVDATTNPPTSLYNEEWYRIS